MTGAGTVNGIIDFGGGTAAAAGTTMNANDTITGTSAISGDVLKVSLQNAGAAIGATTAAVAQVNTLTIPTVVADVQQSNQYVFDTGGAGGKTQTYTYGGSNGSFTTSTTAATNADNFLASVNAVAGSTVAFKGGTATITSVSTGTKVVVGSDVTASVKVGMTASADNSYSSTITNVVKVGATTEITLAKTITAATGTTLTYGGGAEGVTVYAPIAGVASPSIAFGPDADPDTGDSTVPTQLLVVANVTGNQGDIVNFTYGGLQGSYTIAADAAGTTSALASAINSVAGTTVAFAGTTQSSTTTNASTAVTLGASNSAIKVGMTVSGSGIAAGTVVTAVSSTSLTLSKAATASASVTLTFGGGASGVTLISPTAGTALPSLVFSGDAGDLPSATVTIANAAAVGGISFGNNSNLDALYVNNISGQAATITQASVAGATQLWADRSTNDVAFTGVGKTTTIGINGNGTSTQLGAVTATYVAETAAANLAINGGAKAGNVRINQADTNLKTVNITSTAGSQTSTAGQVNTVGTITLDSAAATLNINATTSLVTGGIATASGLRTVNVSGAATSVDLGTLLGTIKTVDGSGLTAGGIKTTLATTAATDFSFTGGAGTDEVTVTGAFSNTITGVNGGGGTADKIVIATAALSTATGAKFSNFEVLENTVSGTQDASVVSGITSVITNGDGSGFSKLTATQAANVTVRNTAGNATFSLLDATGTSDTLSLTLQNAKAADVANVINPGALTVNGIETVNVVVNAGATSIYASGNTGANVRNNTTLSSIAFASSGAVNLTALNVTGAYGVIANLTYLEKLATFNASANTGGVVVTTGPTSSGTNTVALTVTGSSTAANLFTLGVMGTNGTQSIVGGTSTDYIQGTQAIIAAATIAGGLGIDTLEISNTGNLTVADATFDNVTGIEKFVLGTTDGTATWVAGTNVNALAAANGNIWDVSAKAITTGTLTLDASTLSAGIKLNADIASSGASTISVYSSSTGADSIKIAATGATKSILVDASGNSTGVTINLAGSTGGSLAGGQTIKLLGGSAADTITGSAYVDSLTGNAGRDTLTGGSGADKFIYTTAATSLDKANVDRITDFTSASDEINLKNGLFGNSLHISSFKGSTTSSAVANTASTTTVNSIDDVYAAITSNADFAASQFSASATSFIARTITFSSGTAQGSYLVVNNGVAGFQATGDFVVQLTTIGAPTIIGNDIVGIS